MKKSAYCLGVFLALSVPEAEAASREIRALFQPDPSQPSKNVLINKTPKSGYCASYPRPGLADTLSGNITIVWDSDV